MDWLNYLLSFLLIVHCKVSKHVLYSVSSEAIKKQESKPKAMCSIAPLYELKLYKDNYELTIRNILREKRAIHKEKKNDWP